MKDAKVLLVEDRPDFIGFVRDAFQGEGIQLTGIATNLPDALVAIAANTANLVILDNRLGGIEAAYRLVAAIGMCTPKPITIGWSAGKYPEEVDYDKTKDCLAWTLASFIKSLPDQT
jgi:CheY-like chemotaxis protein